YLLQDKEEEAGKDGRSQWRVRVPWSGVHFDKTPPAETTAGRTDVSVDGQFVSIFTSTGPTREIKGGEQRVVFFRYYFPREGEKLSIDATETLESLVKKATGGRIIVAVSV